MLGAVNRLALRLWCAAPSQCHTVRLVVHTIRLRSLALARWAPSSTVPSGGATSSPIPPAGRNGASSPSKLTELRDRHHELLAQVAGLEIEIAMLQGDRPAACEAQVRMFAEIAARRALRGMGLNGGL